MKIEHYAKWVRFQAKYFPWTKHYKYRKKEERNMQWQHKFLTSHWFGKGHYKSLHIDYSQWITIKQLKEQRDKYYKLWQELKEQKNDNT